MLWYSRLFKWKFCVQLLPSWNVNKCKETYFLNKIIVIAKFCILTNINFNSLKNMYVKRLFVLFEICTTCSFIRDFYSFWCCRLCKNEVYYFPKFFVISLGFNISKYYMFEDIIALEFTWVNTIYLKISSDHIASSSF